MFPRVRRTTTLWKDTKILTREQQWTKKKIKGLAISNRGNDMNLDQGFLWHSLQDKNIIINKISSSNIEYQVQNKMSTSFEVQQNIICTS